ncbi:hypothetical protein K504DRAFT_495532 [Pleomassaria siparia CBS 279.74]|uniref:Uncharacterized protein n=1 Tax=Pleomassaria siparia CBS 279.74 TaxID=1314801 RepID=A0A6G1JS02_9PLEO|nr:hypothetical protein K504DRAFT_495532 [Pleomassaria siparia CBS 279.74]
METLSLTSNSNSNGTSGKLQAYRIIARETVQAMAEIFKLGQHHPDHPYISELHDAQAIIRGKPKWPLIVAVGFTYEQRLSKLLRSAESRIRILPQRLGHWTKYIVEFPIFYDDAIMVDENGIQTNESVFALVDVGTQDLMDAGCAQYFESLTKAVEFIVRMYPKASKRDENRYLDRELCCSPAFTYMHQQVVHETRVLEIKPDNCPILASRRGLRSAEETFAEFKEEDRLIENMVTEKTQQVAEKVAELKQEMKDTQQFPMDDIKQCLAEMGEAQNCRDTEMEEDQDRRDTEMEEDQDRRDTELSLMEDPLSRIQHEVGNRDETIHFLKERRLAVEKQQKDLEDDHGANYEKQKMEIDQKMWQTLTNIQQQQQQLNRNLIELKGQQEVEQRSWEQKLESPSAARSAIVGNSSHFSLVHRPSRCQHRFTPYPRVTRNRGLGHDQEDVDMDDGAGSW